MKPIYLLQYILQYMLFAMQTNLLKIFVPICLGLPYSTPERERKEDTSGSTPDNNENDKFVALFTPISLRNLDRPTDLRTMVHYREGEPKDHLKDHLNSVETMDSEALQKDW